MARFVPRGILTSRAREDWSADVQQRHRALTQHSKEDARLGLLRMIRSLPYGGSIFFPVKRIEDPIGLLPGRGLHSFPLSLNSSLLCPCRLNLSLLCLPYNPN